MGISGKATTKTNPLAHRQFKVQEQNFRTFRTSTAVVRLLRLRETLSMRTEANFKSSVIQVNFINQMWIQVGQRFKLLVLLVKTVQDNRTANLT